MAEETKSDSIPIKTFEEEDKQPASELPCPEVKSPPKKQIGKQQRRRQRQAEIKQSVTITFKTDEELNEIELKRQKQKQAHNQRQRHPHSGPKMNRQEREIAEQWGLVDSSGSFAKDEGTFQAQTNHHKVNQDFMISEQAEQIICDPQFGELYAEYMEKATAADEAGELMPNLPQEDDAGNVEYKLRLTNLTLEKVRKRTTQMAFRLKEGQGLAFYQIGVHDSGQVIGLSDESICETLCVVFYMASYLKAKISLVSVGLAPSGHCIELRVTKPQPKHKIQPEIDSFLDGLRFLNKSRIENQKRKDTDSEEFQLIAKSAMQSGNPEHSQHDPATKSPKNMQTSGFAQPQRRQSQDDLVVQQCVQESCEEVNDHRTSHDEYDPRQRPQTGPT